MAENQKVTLTAHKLIMHKEQNANLKKVIAGWAESVSKSRWSPLGDMCPPEGQKMKKEPVLKQAVGFEEKTSSESSSLFLAEETSALHKSIAFCI